MELSSILIGFGIVIVALTIHEAAHAWTADRLGDPTARLLGRVSLNPAVHIDPLGTILLPLLAVFSGLPIIGWAKPVPVIKQRLRNPRYGIMAVAAAGPGTNLVLAAIGALLLGLLLRPYAGLQEPTGLPALASMKFSSGRRAKRGLPSRTSYFVLMLDPITCSGGVP